MSPAIVVAIVLFVVFDLLIAMGVVYAIVRNSWAPWSESFPPRDPAAGAVRRDFQSFKLGAINGGRCIHVAVDEEHLHLTPGLFLRWFGAGPLSIPWADVAIEGRSRNGKWVRASIEGRKLQGPAWCLELAGDGAPGLESESEGR